MCCFSQPINDVTGTNIFARMAGPGHQLIAYGMTLDAPTDVSMILPIPVVAGSGEDAVKFVDYSHYPNFFTDLEKGFPVPSLPKPQDSSNFAAGSFGEEPKLKVTSVGNFEASFVPKISDFARLDARFRLPEETWKALPQYSKFGFAVFKLKKMKSTVHPMVFSFPSADPKTLFFPTVHIHDGMIHKDAKFDHALFCQVSTSTKAMMNWRESAYLAKSFINLYDNKLLVLPENHVYRIRLKGSLKNEDTLVALA